MNNTLIYPFSLHDALPIQRHRHRAAGFHREEDAAGVAAAGLRGLQPLLQPRRRGAVQLDRKSTRLKFSHVKTSYAAFRLKIKREKKNSCFGDRSYSPPRSI